MFVGILRLSFRLPGCRSLKEKRSVVRSFRDRVRAKWSVSIAEVGKLDCLTGALVAVTVVSNEREVCDGLLSSIASHASLLRDAIVVDYSTDILVFAEEPSS
jgi:uncharacterized protein